MIKQLIAITLFLLAWMPASAVAEKCRISDYPHEIECGVFNVKNPVTGKTDQIAWRRVEARARYPLPDPVVWIPGGLGVNASDRAPSVISMLSRLQNSRDLIWLDIIGSGSSNAFSCAQPKRSKISEKIDVFSNFDTLQACHTEITTRGGLQVFKYDHIAYHYEKLRHTLRLQRVNVIADGVGGNIALAWHQLAPRAIRSMVLDSPPPLEPVPDISRAKSYAQTLKKITISCQQDKSCKKYHPKIASYLDAIKAKLPINILLTNPHTGLKERLIMDEDTFAQLLMSIIRTPARASALPNVLNAASEGDWQPMIGLGSMSWAKLNTKFSQGLWLASLCANSQSHPEIQLHGEADWFYQMQKKRIKMLCLDKWGTSTQYSLPKNIPIMIFSPLADPFAAHSLKSSENIKVIQVPGASSGVIGLGCARDIVFRFLTDKKYHESEQGDTCLTEFPLPVVGPVNQFGRMVLHD